MSERTREVSKVKEIWQDFLSGTQEENPETYTLSVGSASGTGTINDDSVSIDSVSDESVTEGGDLVHTVTLTGSKLMWTHSGAMRPCRSRRHSITAN